MILSKAEIIETVECPLCEASIGSSCYSVLDKGPCSPHTVRIWAAEKIHANKQKGLDPSPPIR